MIDLATDHMGLRLRNPLVAAASPLSQTVDGVRRLADAGVGAVVLYSLFEEQLRDATAVPARSPHSVEQLTPREYLSLLERAGSLADLPVIGSLNGATPGGWERHARERRGERDRAEHLLELPRSCW